MITEANLERMSQWTCDELARQEQFAEWILLTLDGCEDDDEIRPALIRDAIREAGVEPFSSVSAGVLRQAASGLREELAETTRLQALFKEGTGR